MTASFQDPKRQDDCLRPGSIILAVYAPFGTDPVLTSFPDGTTHDLEQHPIVLHLKQVAETGVHAMALIDLYDDDTYLVKIPAYEPARMSISSHGKQQMDSPTTLTDFLLRVHAHDPAASVVLTMEGHGAGFLPDLDKRLMTLPNFTANGTIQWRLGGGTGSESEISAPFTADGNQVVAQGSPVLPIGGPTCPTNHLALSTWALASAFQQAEAGGMPKLSVVHLNNCFNMAVEVLHTIAPYAGWATGYCNYNFFTAGQPYPLVFRRLAERGSATSGELARWFAEANHAVLAAAGHEPTVAGTVELARMVDIAEKVDALSDALLDTLRGSAPPQRATYVQRIKTAIIAAQQYDSRPDYILETPDELTDLDSFAAELMKVDFAPYKVAGAADALRTALSGIKQYGDIGSPWMDPAVVWNFSSANLAMSIFLPDPLLNGMWDWRSQYYLDINPNPAKPPVQAHIIDFLTATDWVDFLIEYHRDVPFVGLLPALIPDMPVVSTKRAPPTAGGGTTAPR